MSPSDQDNADAVRAKAAQNGVDERRLLNGRRLLPVAAPAIRKHRSDKDSAPQAADGNAPASAEAGPSGGVSKKARIAKRVTQLKKLLEEGAVGDPSPIRSEEDLEEFEEARMLLNPGAQLSDFTPGYPETEDGYAEHCRELYNAMKNLVDIDDVKAVPGDNMGSSPSGKDSIAVIFLKSKKPIELEILASSFLRAIRKAQLGRLFLGGKEVQKFGSFTLRFRAVVDVLKTNKLLVRSAFDGDEWINRIALNPRAELQRKRTNKKVNDARIEKQKLGAMMKRQDPNLNLEDFAKAATAMKGPPSTATPGTAAQAQPGQFESSKQGSSGSSGGRQMESDTGPAERPSKRAKSSIDQATLQVARASDGEASGGQFASVSDQGPMNVPRPIRGHNLGFSDRSGTENTSQLRNISAGVHTPVKNEEVVIKAEDEDPSDNWLTNLSRWGG